MTETLRLLAALAFTVIYWPCVALFCKLVADLLEWLLRRAEERDLERDMRQ